MPTAHCVSTIEGVILEFDQAFVELMGRPESELVGASYRSITYEDDLDRSAQMLHSLVNKAAPVRLQKRYIRPDGSLVAANVYVTRFDNPERLVSTLFWTESGRALPPSKLWETVLRIRHMQAARVREFGVQLSTDPIGLLLATIYLAEAEGRVVGLPDIVAQTGSNASTMTRWLNVMEEEGLIGSLDHIERDVHFTLSGLAKMERFLAAAHDLSPVSIDY